MYYEHSRINSFLSYYNSQFNNDDFGESYRLPSHTRALKASMAGPRAKKARMDDRTSVQPTLISAFFASPEPASAAAPASKPVQRVLASAFKPPSAQQPVMKSAFKPPFTENGYVVPPEPACPKWTRDIELIGCLFKRSTGTYNLKDGLKVKLHNYDEVEEIFIAKYWEETHDNGFIGKGSSKCGIYVCVKFCMSMMPTNSILFFFFCGRRQDTTTKNMF